MQVTFQVNLVQDRVQGRYVLAVMQHQVSQALSLRQHVDVRVVLLIVQFLTVLLATQTLVEQSHVDGCSVFFNEVWMKWCDAHDSP
ncbi:hypothetical protein D3C86_1714600 [compost metagenome]